VVKAWEKLAKGDLASNIEIFLLLNHHKEVVLLRRLKKVFPLIGNRHQ